MATYEAVTHTPGPWTLNDRLNSEGRLAVCQDGVAVALVCARGSSPASGPQYFEREANARLIAAAPELLAALRGLARGAPAYPCFCQVATGKATAHTHRCVAAVDAIAKAEGR